jgi:anti-sigma28 factor (negative regulator of flagellin synthesis)
VLLLRASGDTNRNKSMRINDQGFTERLPGSAGRAEEGKQTGGASSISSSSSKPGSVNHYGATDKLQLSNIASQLQSLGQDSSSRAAHVQEIAKAVHSKTYQVNAAAISHALVSESIDSVSAV